MQVIDGSARLLCILLGSSACTFMKVHDNSKALLFTKGKKAGKMALVTLEDQSSCLQNPHAHRVGMVACL